MLAGGETLRTQQAGTRPIATKATDTTARNAAVASQATTHRPQRRPSR
jgi:hypothetical protein